MAGVNKVILIGNLGADPEVRYLESGAVVASFNIATSEKYTDKRTNQPVEQTEWHRIELWDQLAKSAEQYLKKGNPVYIEGKLRTEKWQDKEGIERTTVKVRATNMTLLGGRPAEAHDVPAPEAAAPAKAAPGAVAPRPVTKAAVPAPPVFEGNNDADDLPF